MQTLTTTRALLLAAVGLLLAGPLQAQTVTFASATANGFENVTSVSIGVTAAGYTSEFPVTVNLVDLTTEASGSDFSVVGGVPRVLTFNTNSTQTISINIVSEALFENDEDVVLGLAFVSAGDETPNDQFTYTIKNDDTAPTIFFTLSSDNGLEGTNPAIIQVTLSAISGLPASIDYDAVDGTASGSGVDYSLASATVTVNAGALTASIFATINNDLLDENNETFTVTLDGGTTVNATAADPATHTHTILDDDNVPTVQFAAATSNDAENVTAVNIQVTLSAVSGRDVTVNFSVAGTATGGGTDHNLASGSTVISAGQSAKDISFTVVDDALNEDDETIVITLDTFVNGSLGAPSTHTYTIGNDDPTPTVDFSTSASNGDEGTTPVDIQVRISAVSGRNVTMTYTVADVTATGGGVDFTLSSGIATITPGNLTTNLFDISASINNDALDEDGETFTLTGSSPTNATLGTNTVHTYTIADNDAPPVLQFTTTSSSSGEGTPSTNIGVTLSTLSGRNVAANYAVRGGTAVGSGEDYTLAGGLATITAGNLTTNFSIAVVNDALDEANETVIIGISGPTNATLGADTTHTFTITDNDSPPSVDFASGSSSGAESSSPTFGLVLSAVSGLNVTVDFSAAGVTAVAGGVDFTLAAGTATISAGATTTDITTAILNDDALDEFDETFNITLSNPSNASVGVTFPTHTFTITDNDVTPTLEFSTATANGLESTSPVTATIALSAASGKNVSVPYSITGTAAGGGVDYTLAAGTASILAGETDSVLSAVIIDDAIYETDETIILTLGVPTNADPGTITVHTYTITNNDAAPTIEFSFDSTSGTEGVTPASIAVTLSVATAVDATVNYAVTGGTATAGGVDFTLAAGTATISAGQTSTTIDVTIVDDIFDEPAETVNITLSGEIDASLGVTSVHTYTITDNDDAPTVAFTTLGSSGDESATPVDLQVDLSVASQLAITVDYAVTELTATRGGVDFTLADGQLSFAAGITTANITATVVDDNIVEPDEAFLVTLANPVNAALGALPSHTYTILENDTPPVAFTVGAVAPTGGTVVLTYWNASNTDLDITVPVDVSANLAGGTIQLQAKIGSGSLENLGAAYIIAGGDLGTDKVLSRTAAEVEGVTNFADDSTLTVGAIITDGAGNSTTGTAGATTIFVDQTAPASFTLGTLVTTAGTVVSGYWNAGNGGISVDVPLASDLTLVGGSIQLEGEADGSFESLGSAVSISQAEVTAGSKALVVADIEAAATGLEELAGYSEGDVLTVRAVLTDVAGNVTTGSISATSLIVDETLPIAVLTYSDTLASQGDVVTITLTQDEDAEATPQAGIAYAVNTVAAADMTATANPAVWTFDFTIPAANDGLATISIAATDLAGNALTAGNLTDATRLLVDNTPPGYILAYTDSLVREGDDVTVTATVEESVQATPTISVDFAGTTDDIVAVDLSMGATDSVWTYQFTTPAGNDGFATVTVAGLDLAGNALTPTSGNANTLKVDNTPPVVTASSPVSNGFIRSTALSYALGETVSSGQVIWTWEGNPGVSDPASPHAQSLVVAELTAGNHTGVITNAPTLAQAGEYKLELIGVDGAGNADTVTLTTVTYDTLAPGVASATVIDGPAADIDSTQSTDSLAIQYGGFDEPTSGIVLYEYALGTVAGDTNIVPWTANGTSTTATLSGLRLIYKEWYYVSVRATDGAGNLSAVVSSDGVRITDKPRLTLNVVQNSVVTDNIQVFITDTLAMADSIRLVIDSLRVDVDSIDTRYFYVASTQFTGTGTHSLVVTGFSGSGDTTRTASYSIGIAKQAQPWVVASADQLFSASSGPGAVNEDRHLLVVNSALMSAAPEGVYRLGDGVLRFQQPIKVSMLSAGRLDAESGLQAIYILRPSGRWEELPTMDAGSRVVAWAQGAGSFRLGPRTIVVPQLTRLQSNYPNPFNPSTRIVFDLGLRDGPVQHASVHIYNLLGQRVVSLFDDAADSGRYELIWRGVDARGAAVASGVYFVRLETSSGYHMTRKMLLVR